jgi:hypothetical protein
MGALAHLSSSRDWDLMLIEAGILASGEKTFRHAHKLAIMERPRCALPSA